MALARLHWLPAANNGRTEPLYGPRYVTVAHFSEDTRWPQEA